MDMIMDLAINLDIRMGMGRSVGIGKDMGGT